MAFTTKNILDIIQGQGKARPSDNTLFDVLTIVAMRHANFMYDTEKTVEGELALAYKSKMFNVANAVIERNQNILNGLLYQTVLVMGNTAEITWFDDIDSNLWANHLGDHILSGFEKIAKVTNGERIAYNAE